MCEVWIDILITLSSAVFVFLIGLYWPIIPKSYRQWHLCRFWSKSVLGDDFVVSYGAFLDSRLTEPNPPPFRFVKRYSDGRKIQFTGPWGNVVADAEIRSASYIINTLSKYRKKAVPVIDDEAAFDKLKRTFISIGSGSSNQITDLILREPTNGFLEFKQEDKTTFIRDKRSGKKFIGFQDPVRKDYGMVLKIPHRRFPGHFLFVCAGLGEWGTSGASWYLATKWRDLQKEFGNNAFGIVVDVQLGSDESACRIFP